MGKKSAVCGRILLSLLFSFLLAFLVVVCHALVVLTSGELFYASPGDQIEAYSPGSAMFCRKFSVVRVSNSDKNLTFQVHYHVGSLSHVREEESKIKWSTVEKSNDKEIAYTWLMRNPNDNITIELSNFGAWDAYLYVIQGSKHYHKWQKKDKSKYAYDIQRVSTSNPIKKTYTNEEGNRHGKRWFFVMRNHAPIPESSGSAHDYVHDKLYYNVNMKVTRHPYQVSNFGRVCPSWGEEETESFNFCSGYSLWNAATKIFVTVEDKKVFPPKTDNVLGISCEETRPEMFVIVFFAIFVILNILFLPCCICCCLPKRRSQNYSPTNEKQWLLAPNQQPPSYEKAPVNSS